MRTDEGRIPISAVREAVEVWTERALQPSYVSVHMSLPTKPPDHVGLWVNAVNGGGDMMLMCTQFQPMRYGLGVALLTDGYFGHDPSGGSFCKLATLCRLSCFSSRQP